MVTGELLIKGSRDANSVYGMCLQLAQETDRNNFLLAEEYQDFKEFMYNELGEDFRILYDKFQAAIEALKEVEK